MKNEISMNKRLMACIISALLALTIAVPTSYSWAETQEAEQETTAPTGITLNKTSLSLYYGYSAQLVAKVEAGQTVTWKSSNAKIATVSTSGMVKGVKPGTATIIAQIADGTSVSCKVSVSLEKAVITKVSSAAYNKMNIKWKKVPGATGYKVYRATTRSGTYKPQKKIKATSYVNSKCATGKKYYYKVRAYSMLGGAEKNAELSKAASSHAKPSKTAIAVKPGVHKAAVKMKKVDGATGYSIYRATSKKGNYKRVKLTKTPKERGYINRGLSGGKTYYYKVRAYKQVGDKKVPGEFSTAKKVKTKKTNLKYSKTHNFYYKDKFTVKAYAYSGGGRTAMGTRARVGAIAVDPSVIPLGTNVYVEGYGHARAEDTGGNINGKTIDVYKNSSGACYQWGVRYKTIYKGVKKQL